MSETSFGGNYKIGFASALGTLTVYALAFMVLALLAGAPQATDDKKV